MSSTRSERSMIFGSNADEYHRWRPTYPAEAVEWVLPSGASVVADVGAGTGKVTESLLARGVRVVAVEPDHRMLDVLRRTYPKALAHESGAENLPLPDDSVDAVLAADAWHWFPFEPAVAEVRRVLRQGGWLGLLWNVVAPVEDWQKGLAALDPDYRPKPAEDDDAGEGPFPAAETATATFPWDWQTTPEDWCSYLKTLSAFTLMDESERNDRLSRAHALVAAACEEYGTATAPVRHEVFCARWTPRLAER